MSDPFGLVADFNQEILGLAAPAVPARLSDLRKRRRGQHMVEELQEYARAETLEDEVDALVDLIYIAMGDLYERGVDGLQHFLEVHGCNMNRERGENVRRPHEGEGPVFDAVKPEGWVGPDHGAIITNTLVHVVPSEEDVAYAEYAAVDKAKVILVGHGRHGKDTVAEMLRDRLGLCFCSSSLFCAERVMLPAFKSYGIRYADAEACYEDRHSSSPVGDHREFWFNHISAYNEPDKARLGKELLAEYDIYVGIRSKRELWALRLAYPDALVVWVDACDRLPPEGAGSMEIEPWMADLVLDNNGSLEQLELGVDALVGGL